MVGRVPRIQPHRLLEVINRFGRTTLGGQLATEIVMGLGVGGLELQRPFVARHGFVHAAKAPQRIAQVIVHLGVGGSQFQRPGENRQRLLRPANHDKFAPKIVVARGIIGPQPQALPQARDGLLVTPLF